MTHKRGVTGVGIKLRPSRLAQECAVKGFWRLCYSKHRPNYQHNLTIMPIARNPPLAGDAAIWRDGGGSPKSAYGILKSASRYGLPCPQCRARNDALPAHRRHGNYTKERCPFRSYENSRMTMKRALAISAAPGMVNIHAHTMRTVTPQRTADSRFTEPTPDMAPVITWVVLTGMPA